MEYKGRKYFITNNGYLKATTKPNTFMHRDVWEAHNGKIQKGMEIHHMDNDKTNNNIDNLQLLSNKEHTKLHCDTTNKWVGSAENKKQIKEVTSSQEVQNKRREWFKTEGGKKHKETLVSMLKNIPTHEHKCFFCGDTYTTKRVKKTKFCSPKCRSAQYRKDKRGV